MDLGNLLELKNFLEEVKASAESLSDYEDAEKDLIEVEQDIRNLISEKE